MKIELTPPQPRPRWSALWTCLPLALCIASSSYATDPMTSPTSIEIREAFAACRAKPTEISRFLCHCDVVDQQCTNALKPEHGRWRTIEVWHGESEAEREVYFHLAPHTQDLFALDQYGQGIILSCLLDVSSVTFHLGNTVNIEVEPVILADDVALDVELVEDGMAVMAMAANTEDAKTVLAESQEIVVLFEDEWGDEVELLYKPSGFGHAVAGWSPLCASPTS